MPTVMLYAGRIPHHHDDPDQRRASAEAVDGPKRANASKRPPIAFPRWVIPGGGSRSIANRRLVETRLSRPIDGRCGPVWLQNTE